MFSRQEEAVAVQTREQRIYRKVISNVFLNQRDVAAHIRAVQMNVFKISHGHKNRLAIDIVKLHIHPRHKGIIVRYWHLESTRCRAIADP
jgi:hypothetical protein